MGRGGCVNGGDLLTTSYSTPVPLIGLYIAAATLVCFIFMTRDFMHGLIHKRPFLPCNWFQMNSLTLTLLQVATKIPVDLTASMPRAEDQLSKLTSTALLCTALGFYMPSLGTMGASERYSTMVALSMTVITVVVNVCIQIGTGPIFAFTTEHIIIIVCMLVLLLFMWSSAIAITTQLQESNSWYANRTGEGTSNIKDVQGLEKLLKELHVLNYTGNPQRLLCETSHHHVFGLLCALSFIVALQATLRSVVFKTMRFCSGVDDYQWSIPFVIVTQLLTIGVGTCSIIYRWCSFIRHTNASVVLKYGWYDNLVARELENLELKILSFRMFGRNISAILQVPKDVIMELLICTQIMLYRCSKWLIGLPIYGVKMSFGVIIAFFFPPQCDDNELGESDNSMVISCVMKSQCPIFSKWIFGMAAKEYDRWTKKYNERWGKHKIPIISLISKWRPCKSECFVFGGILQSLCDKQLGIAEYEVSCVSVLVLSRMLKELMPSSSTRGQFVKDSSKALDGLFEIIYYVDHNTLRHPKGLDFLTGGQMAQSILLTAGNVWANWENPKHWFHEIISNAFTLPKNFENSNSDDQLLHVIEVLGKALQFDNKYDGYERLPLIARSNKLVRREISALCKFILKKEHESIEDLFDFLEKSFVKMLCLKLSHLPKAISKEIQGDYPYGISEGNVREAFKFFCALKSLDNAMEWSWEDEFLSTSEENEVQSFEAEAPSIGAHRRGTLDLINEEV